MKMKMKATYTFIEQLYSGAQRVICVAAYNKRPPTLIKETLERLAVMPSHLTDLNKAAARSGALTALIRAKAWVSDLELADLGKGFPVSRRTVHILILMILLL